MTIQETLIMEESLVLFSFDRNGTYITIYIYIFPYLETLKFGPNDILINFDQKSLGDKRSVYEMTIC